MKTTEEKVIEIVRLVKEIKYPITADMSLTDDLYLDSLDMLMVINEIESDFSCEVDPEKAEKVKTIRDIVEVLEARKLQSVKDEKH